MLLGGSYTFFLSLFSAIFCSSDVSVEFPSDLGVGEYSSAGIGLASSCLGLECVMILTIAGGSSGGLKFSQKVNELSIKNGGYGLYLQDIRTM